MTTIITRAAKGSPLTNNEMDTNLTNLNTDKVQAISVQMTAAASGSSGIRVLNNDDINFGAGNFSIHWEGALPDWTFTSAARLWHKYQDANNSVRCFISADGEMGVIADAGGVEIFDERSVASVETVLAAGQNAKLTYVCTRETASTDGSMAFYINGALFDTQAIPAAATVSISNTGQGNISCSGTTGDGRLASTTRAFYLYNRALTADEVLSLCINSPALADRGASQTPVYTSDFSAGVDGFSASFGTVTGNNDAVFGRDNVLQYSVTSTGTSRRISQSATTTILAGSRYQIKISALFPSTNSVTDSAVICDSSGTVVFANAVISNQATDVWVDYVFSDIALVSVTSGLRIYFGASASPTASATSGDVANMLDIQIKKIGITSELLASNAQSDTGQIFDTSGNKNHALLPASGATVVGRPVSQTREVRWTNTWAGTNELQYIGGVNQAILPANAYIESIIGTVSGATPHDIIIGDGSDTDRYVTITTGLAAGTTNFALAARTTDGTNLKLTVDPDTNATMSIAWVISYRTLE